MKHPDTLSSPLRYRAAACLDRMLLLLVLAGVALFILYPIVSVVATSLFRDGQFTLEYYQALFTEKNASLIRNSLFVATLSSLGSVTLSFLIALNVYTLRGRSGSLIRSGLLLTMISPPFVSALVYIMLFGRRGIITHQLLGLSINPYGWHGVVILQIIGSISFATLMLLTAFDHLDARLILASRDLGASPGETLRHVILPLIRPALLSVLLMLFTMNLADFGTPIVIGGSFRVLATEAYLQVISSSNLGRASAISVMMVPAAAAAFYCYSRAMKQEERVRMDGRDSAVPTPYTPSRPIALLARGATVLFFAVMALKYGMILLSSLSNTASGTLTFTLKYWGDLPRSQWSSFGHSLVYSAVAAAGAAFLGILLSYFTTRRKLPGMRAVEFMASLPYIIPGTFFGLGYVAAFSHEPIYIRGTAGILILNMLFRQVSLTNKSANAHFATLNPNLEHAARDLGANRLQILFGVLFPILRSSFVTGFVSIFTSCMTSVGAVIFLISPGKNLASAELFQSIENGRYGVASVQAVLLILVTVGINLAFTAGSKRTKQRRKPYVFTA